MKKSKKKEYLSQLERWTTLNDQEKEKFFNNMNLKCFRELVFMSNFSITIAECIKNVKKLKLNGLNKYLSCSIANGNIEKTAMFLDYKNKKYTKEELAQFEENLNLVEVGLEHPSIEQLRDRGFVLKIEKDSIIITGFKGNQTSLEISGFTNKGKPIEKVCNSSGKFNSIQKLYIAEGIKELDKELFAHSNLAEILLPSTSKTLPSGCFSKCKSLTHVDLPNVTLIEEKAFEHSGLSEITLSNQLETIPSGCFDGCRNLTLVDGMSTLFCTIFSRNFTLHNRKEAHTPNCHGDA